ncbi:hypothetical protein BUALT_Bualt08G0048200 [Buddleja alternifolia]|uniref:Inhibitor I9 domain-containing protein n=1 Tax=Buddleja alternifolia TaxID=168488 RepID=A0AAV6X4Z3_9LAMI|nr:hypothetical protein BUALT_Bualt08G0048200 [Buddleja alternifolia]
MTICFVISISVERKTHIVHMDNSRMPMAFSSHYQWYFSTIASTKSTSLSASSKSTDQTRILYTNENAFHDFSATLSKDELGALKKLPGFVSAYSNELLSINPNENF